MPTHRTAVIPEMAVEQCITGPLLIAILTASEINRPSLSRCAREGHLQDGCHDVPLSSWSGTSVPRRPFHRVFRRRFSASSNAFCKPSPAHCTSLSSQHIRPSGVSIAGPTVWNSLPDELRDPAYGSDSLKQFLKTILFSLY